jgi:hypothetical protein
MEKYKSKFKNELKKRLYSFKIMCLRRFLKTYIARSSMKYSIKIRIKNILQYLHELHVAIKMRGQMILHFYLSSCFLNFDISFAGKI